MTLESETSILSGIRVIELATYVLAPGAATVMSDFGAEVIKIERPKIGDPYRYLSYVPPMPKSEMNYCWLLDGRNKRSLALDLTSEEGRKVLLQLIATADVLVTNFQPSILKKLRLTYEDLQPLNDRLIYASATGYGESGPLVEAPGFDMTAYWARSGLMDSVHNGDSEPTLSVAGQGDHPSSITLFGAIMLALFQRDRSGKGAKVTTSLLANGAWANGCMLQAALCGAEPYKKPARSEAFNPLVNHYVTSDDKRFIFCLIQTEKDWPNLCRAIDRPDLIDDPRFAGVVERAAASAELVAIIDAVMATKTLNQWAVIFAENDLVWSPVLSPQEAASDEQMITNDIFVDFNHPQHGLLRTVNSPLFVEGSQKVSPQPAPGLGQHTREVMLSLGYEEDEINSMVERGVIAY